MRVLVTGGAGYIGSVICSRLQAHGHEVWVYDDLSRGHRAAVPRGALLVQGDIRDGRRLGRAIAEHGCDAVLHMAALAEVAESVAQPELYADVNVAGTETVIHACRVAGVQRLVFSSSCSVYGEPAGTPITEDAALAPTHPYGESKLAGERALAATAEDGGFAFAALRYFNACGADGEHGEDHEPESHLIPLALRAVREGQHLRVYGDDYPTPDGTCVRDYVHVVDLAEAHIAALEGLPATSGVFNLGTGDGDSVLEVLAAVEMVTGTPVPHIMAPRRPGDPPALVASHDRAARLLGWRPQRHLAQAVADAWAWMRANPQGYED